MYDNGEGVPEDDSPSRVSGYRQAAEQGDAPAPSTTWELMYRNGEGVPEDDRQAVFWLRQAAEQGHASAQYNAGGDVPQHASFA